MEVERELTDEYRALLTDFVRSQEYADARSPGDAGWVECFLDAITCCEWSLDELDIHVLTASLFDGMGWTIEEPPEDPAAVARELLAFLLWARRTGAAADSPAYTECCVYLASDAAAKAIAENLGPIELDFHAAGEEPACPDCDPG